MRVLVVKLSSLGDVIHTLPALTDAAAAIPGIVFDWVIEEAYAEIPRWHPAVDNVIPVALRRWRKRPLRDFRGPEWRAARVALRRHHYDAVIDAQGLIKSAFIARLVKAPRFGMDRHSVRERLAAAVYHRGISVPREMHAIERIRLLFARSLHYPVPTAVGHYGLQLQQQAAATAAARALLFFHGTAQARKLWPEASWIALAEMAIGQGYKVLLPFGNTAERTRAERIANHCAKSGDGAAVQVLPALNLAGIATELLRVRAVVAVDTGLGHLAAALAVPTVSLYGPTLPALVGTYGNNQLHLRPSPAGDRAASAAPMGAIDAAEVWDTLQVLLYEAGSSSVEPSQIAPPGD